ncbi:multi-copper oxidase, putative [Paecilomyces variotii No. 5]|uniref:Multi-copper oxidase, putative n=1 Tax=Byssochlamys spectabilis (strain No. 5 / NBRC 109023) TaxID=1356009 RepID=V5FTN8_BYSSN|nr:multi-copper oxidase, putative [Paecilomyces variotii No. 5]
MLLYIFFTIYALLTTLPSIAALQQIRHDSQFQPDYILRISSDTINVACRSRLSTVVNGTSPAPPLYLKENQTTWVRVYNDLEYENTTIHWHGLSQSVAPYSDGTPQASQWPIKAQHFFDYELHPKIGEAGTYFYHSHVGFQAVSAAGPLIVEEADGQHPYNYDEERILFFSELFNNTDKQIMEGLTAPYAQFLWPGEAEAILVNGNGFGALLGNETGATMPFDNRSTSEITQCNPEIIQVEANKSYRFRAISGVAMSPFVFGFEDHDNLTVISADGRYTQPASTDIIQMGTGQRYDFILSTKTEEELQALGKTEFWVQIETRYRELNNTFYAILSYSGNSSASNESMETQFTPPSEPPISIPYSIQDWLEYTLEPLMPNGFPSSNEVTRTVTLTSAQFNVAAGTMWTINNHTWKETNEHQGDSPFNDTNVTGETPYLVNIYNLGEKAIPDYDNAVQFHQGWDSKLNVYPAKVGEVIDIILVNEPNGQFGGFDAHPFHFHGAHVWDMGSGPGAYDAAANEEKLKGYSPILRDTSMLFKYTASDDIGGSNSYTSQGWRAWRLKVTDPGVWLLHCHILQHMIEGGMQTVWVVGNASEITRDRRLDLTEGYLTFGGNAYGNSTYDPFVTHFYDE